MSKELDPDMRLFLNKMATQKDGRVGQSSNPEFFLPGVGTCYVEEVNVSSPEPLVDYRESRFMLTYSLGTSCVALFIVNRGKIIIEPVYDIGLSPVEIYERLIVDSPLSLGISDWIREHIVAENREREKPLPVLVLATYLRSKRDADEFPKTFSKRIRGKTRKINIGNDLNPPGKWTASFNLII